MSIILVLEVCAEGNHIVFGNDLTKKIKEHNQDKSQSTKSRTLFHLIYYEAYISVEPHIIWGVL